MIAVRYRASPSELKEECYPASPGSHSSLLAYPVSRLISSLTYGSPVRVLLILI